MSKDIIEELVYTYLTDEMIDCMEKELMNPTNFFLFDQYMSRYKILCKDPYFVFFLKKYSLLLLGIGKSNHYHEFSMYGLEMLDELNSPFTEENHFFCFSDFTIEKNDSCFSIEFYWDLNDIENPAIYSYTSFSKDHVRIEERSFKYFCSTIPELITSACLWLRNKTSMEEIKIALTKNHLPQK